MSALCMYSCGKYTDEPDGICRKCKGFSSVAEILGGIDDIKKTTAPYSPPYQGGDGEVNHGGEEMSEFKGYHKKCNAEGCEKQAWKGGMCYRHWHIKYPDAKKSGGGNQKSNMRKRAEKQTKDNPTHPPLVKGRPKEGLSNGFNDVVKMLMQKRAGLRDEIIDIEATMVSLRKHTGVEIPELIFIQGEPE